MPSLDSLNMYHGNFKELVYVFITISWLFLVLFTLIFFFFLLWMSIFFIHVFLKFWIIFSNTAFSMYSFPLINTWHLNMYLFIYLSFNHNNVLLYATRIIFSYLFIAETMVHRTVLEPKKTPMSWFSKWIYLFLNTF